MSVDTLWIIISSLFGSWIVLVVQVIRRNKEVERLKAKLELIKVSTSRVIQQVESGREYDGMLKLADAANSAGLSIETFAKSLTSRPTGITEIDSYRDKDGDGVPDAFQNRKPLSELLDFDKQPAEPGEPDSPGRLHIRCISTAQNEYWIAVELPARPPRKGEYFILNEQVMRSTINYSDGFKTIIIKAARDCCPEDLVELTK